MSYGVSAALQAAIFEQLTGNAMVTALVGDDIFDAPPAGTPPDLYVSLGREDVRDRSDKDGAGAQHDLTISVVTETAGFQTAKTLAAAISDALAGPMPALERGHLISMRFLKAQARMDRSGGLRRIDINFRALVQDD